MWPFIVVGFVILGVAAARGVRVAYVGFVALGIFFMLARTGFQFTPQPCELKLSIPLALHSLTNYNHIVLFAGFFIMTRAQFRRDDPYRLLKAAVVALAMGTVIELEQALVGKGHCRLRDLIPDTAGMGVGAAIMALWDKVARRPKRIA